MSHFSCLVIGPDPEEQLAPYSEHIKVPEYINKDGDKSTYNPNSKWDYYLLGGRWGGVFKLKSNIPADQALKGLIDFEGMKDDVGEDAKKEYEDVGRIFDCMIPKLNIRWETDMFDGGKYADLDIEEKRRIYNEQPGMKRFHSTKDFIWKDRNNAEISIINWLDLEDFQCSKEEYIENARNKAFIPFAVVKDGEWYERGSMGWFGIVFNEKNKDDWNKQVMSLIMELPDETLLSIYDCHI